MQINDETKESLKGIIDPTISRAIRSCFVTYTLEGTGINKAYEKLTSRGALGGKITRALSAL